MRLWDPSRRVSMPFDAWPEPDRAAWVALSTDGDIWDDAGRGSHWSDGTRRLLVHCYGAWIFFLARHFPADLERPPAERVTRQRILAYLAEMDGPGDDGSTGGGEKQAAPATKTTRIRSLEIVIARFAPQHDWRWLRRIVRRLHARANATALKPYIPVAANNLFQWALERLKQIDADGSPVSRNRAVTFRDTLIVAMLISCPVRRRAFLCLDVEHRVQRVANGYVLAFRAEDMKDKKARDFPLHPRLTGHMDRYLNTCRPALMTSRAGNALWVSLRGTALDEYSLYHAVLRTTERAVGRALSPHDFRRIAATSIAEYDPVHAGIIRDILGHASLDMAEKHYNRARSMDAIDRYQDAADGVRRKATRGRRGSGPRHC